MPTPFTQYFNEDGSLIPQTGEIKEHVPGFWEARRDSSIGKTWVGKIIYGVLDDAWITLQCFTVGHANARHLAGESAIGQETVSAGINTLSMLVPIGQVNKGQKVLNAAQFNSLYKGTGINTIKKGGVETLKRHNLSTRELEALQQTYKWFSMPLSYGPYIIENE